MKLDLQEKTGGAKLYDIGHYRNILSKYNIARLENKQDLQGLNLSMEAITVAFLDDVRFIVKNDYMVETPMIMEYILMSGVMSYTINRLENRHKPKTIIKRIIKELIIPWSNMDITNNMLYEYHERFFSQYSEANPDVLDLVRGFLLCRGFSTDLTTLHNINVEIMNLSDLFYDFDEDEWADQTALKEDVLDVEELFGSKISLGPKGDRVVVCEICGAAVEIDESPTEITQCMSCDKIVCLTCAPDMKCITCIGQEDLPFTESPLRHDKGVSAALSKALFEDINAGLIDIPTDTGGGNAGVLTISLS